jgi:hypothetical protein
MKADWLGPLLSIVAAVAIIGGLLLGGMYLLKLLGL